MELSIGRRLGVVTRLGAFPHLVLRCPNTILLLPYILNEDYVNSQQRKRRIFDTASEE